MAKPINLKNRITGLELIKGRELLPNERNWRTHPDSQADALAGVLSEIGISGAILAYRSQRNNGALTVIDGHLRRDNWLDTEWPVLLTDLNDDEADYMLTVYDPLGAMAGVDMGILAQLVEKFQDNDTVMSILGQSVDLSGLIEAAAAAASEPDPGAQIDKADELRQKWGVEPGQLWQLGKHRLICGDCRDTEAVERLLQGERVGIILTDAPYGVAYKNNKRVNGHEYKREQSFDDIENDALSPDEFYKFAQQFIGTFEDVLDRNAVAYLFTSDKPDFRQSFESLCKEIGLKFSAYLAWDKGNFGFGFQNYRARHEGILYFKYGSVEDYWVGGQDKSTIIQINKDANKDYMHPTQKPVELAEFLIANHSFKMVYDPFAGSGFTLIACERLGRKCRAVELEPGYCAVILQRWADMTGQEPVLQGALQ